MRAKELIKNKFNIRFSGKDIYLEKTGIVQDRICKNCKKLILTEKDFCECGFFLKAEKNSIFWNSVLLPLFFIGIICLVGIINFENIKSLTAEKVKEQKISFNSLSPVNIQMITSIKGSPYDEYVQNIYIKQGQKNRLIILVKPTYWDFLTSKEKKNLLNYIGNIWKTLYKKSYPNSVLKPNVEFANPE